MKILQLTSHFSPNVGGVETHLDDLVNTLANKENPVFVLTYKPLVTKIDAKIYETRKNIKILRIPWFTGLFYKLVKNPVLEFVYLFLGLFIVLPFILLFENPDVVHTHGLVAGFVGIFWGRIFRKRVITTTHSIYLFPESGLYRMFSKFIFNSSNVVLTLSKQSKTEIEKLGIKPEKVKEFTYWVDLEIFKPIKDAKETLSWNNSFVVLFVGRLIKKKGIYKLIDAAKSWNRNIDLKIIGSGPGESEIKKIIASNKNIKYLGRVNNNKLPVYYCAADLVIVPSIHEEGFGRVIIESLSLATIPDETVADANSSKLQRVALPANVTVVGDYLAIRSYVESLRNVRRSFIVDTVTFSIEENRGDRKLRATVTLNMPYFGVPS